MELEGASETPVSSLESTGGDEAPVTQEAAPETTPQEKTIPMERFNQVYGKMKDLEEKYKAYSEFGDPYSVKSRLEKQKEWESAIEKHRTEAAQTPDEKEEAQRLLLIQKELFKVMPNLKNLEKLEQLQQELESVKSANFEAQAAVTLEKHSHKFGDVLKEAKIDSKFQSKIEDYIVNQMNQDERVAFVRGDFDIAKRIFDNELKDGLFSMMRAQVAPVAPVLGAPPVRNTPGGTPPSGKVHKATTMKEAEDMAWARLSGRK